MSGNRKSKRPQEQEKPPVLLPALSGYRIEVRRLGGGEKAVLVSQCNEILSYRHEEVRFLCRKAEVCVCGVNLWCRAYGNHVAEVVGHVTEIHFAEEGKK